MHKGVHLWYAKTTLKAITEFSTAEIYDTNVCRVPPFITQRKTPPSFMQCALSITAFTQRNLLQMTDRTSTNKLIRLLPQVLSIHIVQNYFHAQIRLAPQILSIHIILNNFYAQRRLPPRFLYTHIIQNCLQQTHRTLMHKLVRHPPQILSKTPSSNSFHSHQTKLIVADRHDFYAQINKTQDSLL